MSHRCLECEICVQLKKGIVPRALDYGYAPCAAALEECRMMQNSRKPDLQAELLLAELTHGDMKMDTNIYYVDTDSDEEPPVPPKLKSELPPSKGFFKALKDRMRG
ncbi:hypothetical protein DSO57_1018845 [Entomophthora muscae]|uniref:Uncharacterized protein n=1 Tax=Entomophthora muscae TaxID=34485 RepID=A0ACC2UD42_9FUNG|nr:hypothetical protein DSO57_1018845 [Entomophthora muscae]